MAKHEAQPEWLWKPGQSGNPAGKPKGTRNRMTAFVQALLEADAEAVARKIIDAAKEGDLTAARLVLERIVPPVKERPLDLNLPDTTTAEGINEAQQIILCAVGDGDVLPGEAATLAGVVEVRRKALETLELERRITALEERNNASK